MSKIVLAGYNNEQDNDPARLELEWSDLVTGLMDVRATPCNPCTGKTCTHKFGPAWSPVDIPDGKSRLNVNVSAVTVSVFDLDHIPRHVLPDVLTRLAAYEYVIHSTHSHRPDDICLRLVMPLSRPVLAKEYAVYLRTVIAELGIPADPQCKDLSRLFFFPSIPEGHTPVTGHNIGHVIDVDALLGVLTKDASMPSVDKDLNDLGHVEVTADLDELRKRVVTYRRRKEDSINDEDKLRYATLGRMLKGESLAEPGARDGTVNRCAALLACIFPADTPVEACTEMMRASIAGMDVEPEGLEHWLNRAQFSYRRAMSRRLDRDTKQDAINARIGAALIGAARVKETPSEALASASTDEFVPASELVWTASGKLAANGENVFVILARDPRVRGSIRWNEVAKSVEIHGGPFAGVDLDVLDTTVADWFTRHWQIQVSAPEVGQRILRVAKTNKFNPVQDYLSAIAWDGTPRIERFFMDYCGARCTNASGDDITHYVKLISMKWFISAVARALQPGCQVDTVLVLEGPQGVRKTSLIRTLGGRWACETQVALGDKDSKMLTASNWLIELAELASVKRSESNEMKAFFTSKEDTYRPPYGRVTIKTPRMCVFIATTNDEGYLRDRTGNRRFWPVYVTNIDLARVQNDLDQLWAEAVYMYNANQRWWLEGAEQKLADEQAEERLAESATEEKVREWWFGRHSSKREPEMTSTFVAEQALLLGSRDITHAVLTDIGVTMLRMGFTKKRTRGTYVYKASDALLKAKQGKPWQPELRIIASAKVES